MAFGQIELEAYLCCPLLHKMQSLVQLERVPNDVPVVEVPRLPYDIRGQVLGQVLQGPGEGSWATGISLLHPLLTGEGPAARVKR